VLQGDEVIELHVAHLGERVQVTLLPFLGHTGQEGQFAGDGGPVEVEEQGDAPLRDPRAEELEHLGIGAALMLPVGFLKGGGREVKFAPIAPPSLHPFSLGATVVGAVFAKLKGITVGIGAALDHGR
jgi:hypothetical protein